MPLDETPNPVPEISIPVDPDGYPSYRPPRHIPIQPRHRIILTQINQGVPLKQAMANVGYTGASLVNPNQILGKTRSWQALMNEFVSEETLAMRHSELLNMRHQRAVKDDTGKIIKYIDEPNDGPVARAVEMGYKLRGSFKEPATAPKSQNIYNLFYQPEIRAQVSAFEDGIKQSMINAATKNRVQIDTPNEDQDGESYSPEDGGAPGGIIDV